MPGVPLDVAFEKIRLWKKKDALKQMAKILKGLQMFKLPETITGFGGVTFDAIGRVVSAEMSTVGAGSWSSYEESFG